MLAALVTVTLQVSKPDYEPSIVFMSAAISAAVGYGWCRIVDWMVAKGHNLP